jgi:hypothetical protein
MRATRTCTSRSSKLSTHAPSRPDHAAMTGLAIGASKTVIAGRARPPKMAAELARPRSAGLGRPGGPRARCFERASRRLLGTAPVSTARNRAGRTTSSPAWSSGIANVVTYIISILTLASILKAPRPSGAPRLQWHGVAC